MKIIVCGAGEIGSNIAKQLVYEDNDVTIIDKSESSLRMLNKSVDLKIEELNTETIIKKLEDNSIDCAIAATPLNNEKIIESPLYYEPFVAYVPKHHHLSGNKYLEVDDLSNGDLLILKDGHCFRNQVLNLCTLEDINKQYELKSGSFETLINL